MLLNIYDDFLLTNLWWIVGLSVLAIFGIWFLIDFLVKRKKRSNAAPKVDIDTMSSNCLEAFGGPDNILEKSLVGSRIVVKLRDYSLLQKETLEKAGVTGFILMSDKLTLVVKDNAAELYKSIFGE